MAARVAVFTRGASPSTFSLVKIKVILWRARKCPFQLNLIVPGRTPFAKSFYIGFEEFHSIFKLVNENTRKAYLKAFATFQSNVDVNLLTLDSVDYYDAKYRQELYDSLFFLTAQRQFPLAPRGKFYNNTNG